MQTITLQDALFPQNSPHTPTTPKQLNIEARQQKVITLILQQVSPGTIAKQLGVDRKTVYNDFIDWAKSEQAAYLQVEWMQQYEQMKQDNPEEAFQALTKLVMKLVEKQTKVEVNLNQEVNINSQVNELIQISRDQTCNKSQS